MDLRVEAWYGAIPQRTSRRTFEARVPSGDRMAQLEETCRNFRPFPEARAEFIREPAAGVFKGIIGSYGRVTGAPAYLAFIGDLASARVQECTGYTGQGLILEAASLGLDTCWVAGFFGRRSASAQVRLRESERVLAVSPVGHAQAGPSLTDRSFKFFAGSKNRKPLGELLLEESVPGEAIRQGLEAARLAPSARNRQPWRFRIKANEIVIRTDKDVAHEAISRRLDCGIAMLHFELGVRAAGLSGEWEFLSRPEVARFRVPPLEWDSPPSGPRQLPQDGGQAPRGSE